MSPTINPLAILSGMGQQYPSGLNATPWASGTGANLLANAQINAQAAQGNIGAMSFAQTPPPKPAPPPPPSTLFNTTVPPEQQKAYQDWITQLPKNLRNTDDYDLQGAFLGGAQPEAGHLTDIYKKPNHMTFSTDSQYSGRNGEVGGRWVKSNDSWTFYASPTNLKYHSAKDLQDYFQRAEPGNTLVLPPGPSRPAQK